MSELHRYTVNFFTSLSVIFKLVTQKCIQWVGYSPTSMYDIMTCWRNSEAYCSKSWLEIGGNETETLLHVLKLSQQQNWIQSFWADGHIGWFKSADISDTGSISLIRGLSCKPFKNISLCGTIKLAFKVLSWQTWAMMHFLWTKCLSVKGTVQTSLVQPTLS